MSKHLVIVGSGPLCTYALERLSVLLPCTGLREEVRISIFDRTGHFGAGATHSDAQTGTSYMNRVASQIAFAADESNRDSTMLLPGTLRPTFMEWSMEKLRSTGEERYRFDPRDIPPRYLHGQALAEMFHRYVAMLRGMRNVTVDLYATEAADVSPDGDGFLVHIGGPENWFVRADEILLVTGHSNNHPAPGSLASKLSLHARNQPAARYIPYAYPLEQQVTEESVPPGSKAGVLGLGLTAIDVLLHLTEGRKGTFVPDGNVLHYVRSGREPETVVGFGPSGMFPSSRPRNDKALDVTGAGHSALEHQGVFLTSAAIATLRERFGVAAELSHGTVRQLDFERHVFPLVVLEMAFVYYGTLLGKAFETELCRAAEVRYRDFLEREFENRDVAIQHLLEPIDSCFEDAAAYADAVERGADPAPSLRRFASMGVVDTFVLVVFGSLDGRGVSPWGHSPCVRNHRFVWRTFFEPLGSVASSSGAEWQSQLIAYMRRDQRAAAQGNLSNPVKAACDGVWRDLRSVLSQAADFGGLTAESHRKFVEVYFRLYTRMSNGAGLEAMSKVLALVEAGIVDVSIGPSPVVEPVADRAAFRIRGTATGAEREVSILIEGRSHPFDPELDMCPLYPNLLRRGMVRRWVNRSSCGSEYTPGGLDLSRSFRPVAADGTANPRLTILGAPVEGIAFFQLSAARPRSNSSILNNVARWANEYVERLTSTFRAAGERRSDSMPAACPPPVTGFRARIRSLLTSEIGASGRAPRNVVILAVDGIPYELAASHWRRADTSKMRAVFPTTSSTGWLSSLTGADVARHGVPGVVFRTANRELINIFEYQGPLQCPATGNIFSDAVDLGYEPWSVMGDWEPYDCSWRSELLQLSRQLTGYRFYTASEPRSPEAICRDVRRAIDACTDGLPSGQPRLVWCFIDADRHIHRHGYDRQLLSFLRMIEDVALDLARDGAIAVAHSDHGLIRTTHNPELEQFIRSLQAAYRCTLGGAGRTRWIYLQPGTEEEVRAALHRCLPASVRICSPDELFEKGSLARARVGGIVLIAEGEEFMTFADHQFDHGSLTDLELHVPFSQWME